MNCSYLVFCRGYWSNTDKISDSSSLLILKYRILDGLEFAPDIGIVSGLVTQRSQNVQCLTRSKSAPQLWRSRSRTDSSFPLRTSHRGDSGSSRIMLRITTAKKIWKPMGNRHAIEFGSRKENAKSSQ